MDRPYLLQSNGLLPGKITTNILEFNRGVCGDSGGASLILLPTEAYVDLQQVGVAAPTPEWFASKLPPNYPAPDLSIFGNVLIGGKDRDFDPRSSQFGIQYWMVQQLSTGNVAVLASNEISYGDVQLPSGWTRADTIMRKHWFGHNYRDDWDGIPNFGIDCKGSEVLFTDAQDAAPFAVAYNRKTGGVWQSLDLHSYLPDAGRLVRLSAEVRYNGGSAGSAYVRTYSAQGTGKGVGSVSPGSPFQRANVTLQLDSTRKMEVMTTGDACLYLYLDAYRLTDPA